MTLENPVKYDFEYFGQKEIGEVADLLTAYKNQDTTDYFKEYWNDNVVKPAFNQYSGYVFLTNEDCQVAMLNNGVLDMFESCPEDGYEGFPEDFKELKCKECQEIYNRIKEVKK